MLPNRPVSKWLHSGERLDVDEDHGRHKHPWYMVLWLTGVDYFSSLGYQPGIALLAAGAIAPLATSILVAVTLACALPIYAQVARRSYAGQGSIAMLENLLPGWFGKTFVLVLLGFAATDFVITMTLSAADAAQHAIENPLLHDYLGDARVKITIGLLALLAIVFLKGFHEAIGLASFVAIPYLILNLVVLVRGVVEIIHHPELFPAWRDSLFQLGDWQHLALASALIFPRLALGLSGFETGVSVMPLVSGDARDQAGGPPLGRIANTRKLLAAAAVIMSVFLLLSSFVTTLLIPQEAYKTGGKAAGRAIAYVAHELLGHNFGTVYDISTILILWFAGASAMAGLLHLIPRYMPRFGMAPEWIAYSRPLVVILFAVDVIVTLIFDAGVEAQSAAYATGVLVLMLAAGIAAALAARADGERLLSLYCWVVAVVFAYTLVDNTVERPEGVVIATVFIVAVIGLGALSRFWRAIELRVGSITFENEQSRLLWESIINKRVNLVPLRTFHEATRRRKAAEIRQYYTVQGPVAFVHVRLLDNRSEFVAPLRIEVTRDGEDYLIQVKQAIAVANAIAYVSELIDPISIFLGLTRRNLEWQALRFLVFGEGETGLMVYRILLRHWEETPEEDVRPLIFLMSD